RCWMPKLHKGINRVATFLEHAVDWVETVVAAVLAVIIVVIVASVTYKATGLVDAFPHDEALLTSIMKSVLDVFIVIELFRITVAYVRHRNVLSTVLETALVVAAREVVVIEAGAKDPMAGLAVAGIMVSIGITWWLLYRAGAVSIHNVQPDDASHDDVATDFGSSAEASGHEVSPSGREA
ncbi:MAG: phosphate-starvation-inducible PsiE family protein, partial [Coriobacteriia bacterium]